MAGFVPADPILADFAIRLTAEANYSRRTATEYARDVEAFAKFLKPGEPAAHASQTLAAVTPADIRRYVLEMRDRRGFKATSVRRKLFALRKYFAFEKQEGRRADNPAADVKPPKPDKTLP